MRLAERALSRRTIRTGERVVFWTSVTCLVLVTGTLIWRVVLADRLTTATNAAEAAHALERVAELEERVRLLEARLGLESTGTQVGR